MLCFAGQNVSGKMDGVTPAERRFRTLSVCIREFCFLHSFLARSCRLHGNSWGIRSILLADAGDLFDVYNGSVFCRFVWRKWKEIRSVVDNVPIQPADCYDYAAWPCEKN